MKYEKIMGYNREQLASELDKADEYHDDWRSAPMDILRDRLLLAWVSPQGSIPPAMPPTEPVTVRKVGNLLVVEEEPSGLEVGLFGCACFSLAMPVLIPALLFLLFAVFSAIASIF